MTDPRAAAGGLVVVDKPSGWTSHQVVARCRRLLGTRKVGHAGTLDPMATGVLLVGYGRATRLLGHLAGHDKTYSATIRLGQSTNTDDADGEVHSAPGVAGITESDVLAALPGFTGRISQVPSSVSAIKVDGKRAYALVRSGQEVKLAAREVTVSRFEVIACRRQYVAASTVPGDRRPEASSADTEVLDVDVEVDCSSGTYIRALARDLGAQLGCGGHLTALRRDRVGAFTLDDVGLDGGGLAADGFPQVLGLAELARRAFDCVALTPEQAVDVGYGRSLPLDLPAGPTALLLGDELLALYRPDAEGGARPLAVLAPN